MRSFTVKENHIGPLVGEIFFFFSQIKNSNDIEICKMFHSIFLFILITLVFIGNGKNIFVTLTTTLLLNLFLTGIFMMLNNKMFFCQHAYQKLLDRFYYLANSLEASGNASNRDKPRRKNNFLLCINTYTQNSLMKSR